MLAMLLHSIVDFNMYVPVNAAVFAWVAGIAAASHQQSELKEGKNSGGPAATRTPDLYRVKVAL